MKKREERWGEVKGGEAAASPRLRLAAVGMEAEFTVFIDGAEVRPEDVFGAPTAFLKGPLMHRTGSSYSLPTGGAVYFDTGVIEVATPVIEVARGCMARAGRSLWEAIGHVRLALDQWEMRTGRHITLTGFSTHYNISFAPPEGGAPAGQDERTVERLALLLTYILPVPVMLLAANRRSTGIGVRPRGDRIEITADFTPSAALMISAGTLIVGIAREVMRWPTYGLDELHRHCIPVIEGFRPTRHTSRKGWLARYDCYPHNPFTTGPNERIWKLDPAGASGDEEAQGEFTLREIALKTSRRFSRPVRSLSDGFTIRMIRRVLRGSTPALLDLDDRPEAYDDVGRLCIWDDLFPERVLERSRYEQVLIRSIAGLPLRIDGFDYQPVGIRGWSEIVFRRSDGVMHLLPLDYLLAHLDDWGRR